MRLTTAAPRLAVLSIGCVALIIFLAGCAGNIQPSPTPLPGGGGTVIVTLPPAPTIERTPTKIPPSPTPRPPTETPITPLPTITPSGPTLDPAAANTKSIFDAAPKTVGNFTLVADAGITYTTTNFVQLSYRTPEGAVYVIKIFVTNGMNDAGVRYVGLTSALQGAQKLTGFADEAIITAAPNALYIAIRFRNATVELYRPDPKGTTPKPLTDDQALALVRAIYQLLPGTKAQ